MAALDYDQLIETLSRGDFGEEIAGQSLVPPASSELARVESPDTGEACVSPLPAFSSLVDVSDPIPLGARRSYMTLAELSELERRLRLSGWRVERWGDELICRSQSGRKPRVQ